MSLAAPQISGTQTPTADGTKQLLGLHILIPASRKEKGATSGNGMQGSLPLRPHRTPRSVAHGHTQPRGRLGSIAFIPGGCVQLKVGDSDY